jgi:hypothetical protein
MEPTAAFSVHFQFAVISILRPQRTAGLTGRTAASELDGGRRLWAVNDKLAATKAQ